MTANDLFTVEIPYSVKFNVNNPVPLHLIIKSLMGYERLLYRTPKYVEAAYPFIEIVETQVLVSRLEEGSWIEDFVVKYVFKGNDNYNKAKNLASDIVEDNSILQYLISASIGGLIVYGAMHSLGGSTPQVNIAHSNIVNVGGNLNIQQDDFIDLLSSEKNKRQLAKDTINAISPAKNENVSIEIEGHPDLLLSPDFVKETPEKYEVPLPKEKSSTYENISVIFYASDRDNAHKGWAGIVPGILDNRTKIILSESIDPKSLHGKTTVKADIEVIEKLSGRSYTPKEVYLSKVYP